MNRMAIALLGAALLTAAFTRITTSPAQATDAAGNPMILAVGDMACDPQDPMFNGGIGSATRCAEQHVSDAMVADIAAANPAGASGVGYDTVLGLGDYQYTCSDPSDWLASYDQTYGRLDSKMDPSAGNHEYQTGTDSYGSQCPTDNTTASTYFTHFGSAASPRTNGHYSFNLGSWHLIALNAQCSALNTGGCSATSAQTTWLKSDLAGTTQRCIMAFWHQPRWSGGYAGGKSYGPWWKALYAAHADVVLNGHVHNYQRYAAVDPTGAVNPAGITEYVVGTGGESADALKTAVAPNPSPVAAARAFGYQRMTLLPTGWTTQFVRVDNLTGATSVVDSSTGTCH